MAKGSDGNSAPSDKGNEATGTYVKVAGLNIDLSQGFVEPTKGLYVREDFAGLVRGMCSDTAVLKTMVPQIKFFSLPFQN